MVQRTILAGGTCGEHDCPTITSTEQGHQADVATPESELVVRLPAALILEAARALGR